MLVLSRKATESVIVDGLASRERSLKVTVLEIRGARVRLGFQATDDLSVHREEVWEQIHACSARFDGPNERCISA